MHACEGDLVCKSVNEKIPYFNAPIYLENKTQIGRLDEILGPINQVVRSSGSRGLLTRRRCSTLRSRWSRAWWPRPSRWMTRSLSDPTSCFPLSASCPSPRPPRVLALPRAPVSVDAVGSVVVASGEAGERVLAVVLAEGPVVEPASGAAVAAPVGEALVGSAADAAAALAEAIEVDTRPCDTQSR